MWPDGGAVDRVCLTDLTREDGSRDRHEGADVVHVHLPSAHLSHGRKEGGRWCYITPYHS